MKKCLFVIGLFAFILSMACHEGYSGAEGVSLGKFIEPESLKKLTESPVDSIWIIDVRPSGAYRKGHIPTAKSFPSGEIMDRLDELPKTQYLILYCETGGRAQMVINKLEGAGYTRLFNWGGYKRWKWDYVKVE